MIQTDDFQKRLQDLEQEFVAKMRARRELPGYRMDGRKVRIDAEARRKQRTHRKKLLAYLWNAPLLSYLTAPVIYLGLVPALALDAYVGLYQLLCFPAYGIPKARRGDYLVMDRSLLPYLNGIERMNCRYCSYFNGLISFVQEVAARTEQHWCPIKHARKPPVVHSRYSRFFEYGDAETYAGRLDQVRRDYLDLLRLPLGGPGLPPA